MTILNDICDALCLDKDALMSFAVSAPHRYKIYEIPKRNSRETRTIAHPSKELKFIQRILIPILEDVMPVHECAFAYKAGVGIKENAAAHINTKYLLKMDFENYFPSITPEIMFFILKNIGVNYDEDDRYFLKNILFRRSRNNTALKLSIGAPSSPLISNFILCLFDEEIKNKCDARKINYTRYADDLTFSTNVKDILFDIPEIVNSALAKHTQDRIKINTKKTIFSSKAHNRHVTGITISNDDCLSIGRDRKRLISSMIHRFTKNSLSNDDIQTLQGLFAFAKHIEPDFHARMSNKYGEDNLIRLIKYRF